ncbi:MAG: hypothetical protein ABUL62_03935 [Myxococcales bacterium]
MNHSRSVFQWAYGVVLVAALVPGCGGSDDVSIEDFPKRLAKVICDQLVGCCRAAAMPLDAGTCNANASAYFQQAFSEQDRSKVHYDGSAADGCLSAYSQALSSCTLQEADSEALDAACSKVFVGTVPVGGICKQGAECAPQSGARVSCNFSSGSVAQGICTLETSSPGAAPHGKQGEACVGSCTSDSCDNFPSGSGSTTTTLCFASEGLYCDLQSTCQPTLADGQPCSYDGCSQASYCDANRICAAKKADGASCTGSSECVARNCVFPDDSASNSGTCGSDSLATAKTCAGNFE